MKGHGPGTAWRVGSTSNNSMGSGLKRLIAVHGAHDLCELPCDPRGQKRSGAERNFWPAHALTSCGLSGKRLCFGIMRALATLNHPPSIN